VYVREAGREIVEEALGESSVIATAMISYAELRATFARLLREQSLTVEEHDNVVDALKERWPTYEKPAVSEGLISLAGDCAQRYALPGYDAVQLASALACVEKGEVRFLAFDNDLNAAAGQVMTLYSSAGES
jgi:predicted nucleic acid-binding protein